MLTAFNEYAKTKYSVATQKAYATDIAQFIKHCEVIDIDPKQAKVEHAISYKNAISIKGIRNSTVSRKLSAVLGFFDWMIGAGMIDRNPFKGVQVNRMRDTARHREVIGPDAFDKLIESIPTDDISCLRDRCVIRVMHDTQVRLRDILRLNIEHFDGARHEIRNAEWKRQPKFRMSSDTSTEMIRYIEMRRASMDKPLFANKHGGRISDRSIRRRLVGHCDTAGINRLSPYAFVGTQRSAVN